MRRFPCLSLRGRLVLLFFPASCLVILYNSLELFCLAAISASFANFSTYVLFSFFVFFLTVLFLSWYSFRRFSSSASLLSFILISLLASIASHVSSVNQSFVLTSRQPRTCSQVSVIAFLHLVHFSPMCYPSSNAWNLFRGEIPSFSILKFSYLKPFLNLFIRLLLCC